jgi:hypothetical protein
MQSLKVLTSETPGDLTRCQSPGILLPSKSNKLKTSLSRSSRVGNFLNLYSSLHADIRRFSTAPYGTSSTSKMAQTSHAFIRASIHALLLHI